MQVKIKTLLQTPQAKNKVLQTQGRHEKYTRHRSAAAGGGVGFSPPLPPPPLPSVVRLGSGG